MNTFRKYLAVVLVLAAGAVQASAYRCGLWTAKLDASNDWKTKVTSFSKVTGIGPAMGHAYCPGDWNTTNDGAYYDDPISGDHWEWNHQNTTFVYSGLMFLEADRTYIFAKSLDDGARIEIDGTKIIEDGTWNSFPTGSFTPTYTGWYPIEIRVGDGSSGKGPYGGSGWDLTMGLGFNTNGLTTCSAPAEGGWIKLIDDAGMGALFRAPVEESFFELAKISKTDGGYTFRVAAKAAGTATVYCGAEAGSVESTSGWGAQASVDFEGAETKDIFVEWDDSTIPYFTISFFGQDSVSRFGQWFDVTSLVPTPAVEAAIAEVTATSATFDVDLSFPVAVEGAELPEISVVAYYGETAGAITTAEFAYTNDFGSVAAGSHEFTLSDLPSGKLYEVFFAVKTADSDEVWSKKMLVNTAGVYLDVPSSVAENFPAKMSFKVCRPDSVSFNTVTVALDYTGDLDRITALPATVTLPAGVASVAVEFLTVDNDQGDGNGTVTISLLPGSDYMLGTPNSADMVIADDETGARVLTWIGSVDTNWGDARNWDRGAVPTALDTAVIPWADGVARVLTINEDAAVRTLKMTSGDALQVTGTGTLTIGNIDRGDSGWPFGKLSLEVPVYVFPTMGITSVWNTAGAGVDVKAPVRRLTDQLVIRKDGTGDLNFMKESDPAYEEKTNPNWHLAEGKSYINEMSSLGGNVSLGGAGVEAQLILAKDQGGAKMNVEVLDMGKFYADRNCWSESIYSITVREGGWAKFGWMTIARIYLYGGKVDTSGGDFAFSWPGELKSYASDVVATFYPRLAFNWWDNLSITAERGDRPVDLILGGAAGDENAEKRLEKNGNGIVQVTGNYETNRRLWITGGTWLADNATSGAPRAKIFVQNGATFGGVGHQFSTEYNDQVSIEVTGNGSTIAPGSIDAETGAKVYGTLSVGEEGATNGVSFADNTRLLIGFAPKTQYDALAVNGTIDIGKNVTLELTAEDVPQLYGGQFVVASAEGGINGQFANFIPIEGRRCRLFYTETQVVVEVASKGLFLYVR